MILCLDIGNTQIHGGVFKKDELVFQFRKTLRLHNSSDELGVFFRAVLRENNIELELIKKISICSVVPDINHSLRNACLKYFKVDPFFLKPGTKTGLKIKYRNPIEVGSDRIANAIAVTHLYLNKNIIVVDFGTATTFCVISKEKEYLGGIILPGLRISMEALESNTAQLPIVEIKKTDEVVGKTTIESIQSGLFYGHIGIIKEINNRIISEAFKGEDTIVIGTGGFSRLFENEKLFDFLIPTLVLQGLNYAFHMNSK